MSCVEVFETESAKYTELRAAGEGSQRVCEWISPASGHHNAIGVAELRNIKISDYRFGFSDLLYVVAGSVTITEEEQRHLLKPGHAILIRKGAIVTIDVPDWLRWIYVTDPGNWRDLIDTPAQVEAIG